MAAPLPKEVGSLFEHLEPQVVNGRLRKVPAIPHSGEHHVPYTPAPCVGEYGLDQNGKQIKGYNDSTPE